MTLLIRTSRVYSYRRTICSLVETTGGALNLPPDVPEPIRRWVASGHRNCRRQNPLPDIVDVVDAWVPMSIDRGIRIEELERRISYLEERQPASARVSHLKADLAAAAGEAKQAVEQLRGLLLRRMEPVDQCPHLVGQSPKVVDRLDQHYG